MLIDPPSLIAEFQQDDFYRVEFQVLEHEYSIEDHVVGMIECPVLLPSSRILSIHP